MPSFEYVIFLASSLHAPPGALGLQSFALEEACDHMGLSDRPAQVQQSPKESIQSISIVKDEVVGILDLIEIPAVEKASAAGSLGKPIRDFVDPVVAKPFHGPCGKSRQGPAESCLLVNGHEHVVAHLKGNLPLPQILSHEIVSIQADRDWKRCVAGDAQRVTHAKVGILDEEIVVVHTPAPASNLALLVWAFLGNIADETGRFLLDLDDAIDGAVLVSHLIEVGRGLVDVALTRLGRDDRDVMQVGILFDEVDEFAGQLLQMLGFVDRIREGKQMLERVFAMLTKLIDRFDEKA